MKKRTLTKALALLLSAAMLLGVMPARTAWAGTAAALADDGEKSYVNLSATEVQTLDLTDKESGFAFHVFDDGGEGGSYSTNTDGALSITAPAGSVMRVEWKELYTESGYDYLYLYNAATVDDDKFIGQYSGYTSFSTFFTSGNVLYVRLTSDSGKEFNGIDLLITIYDLADLATVSFLPGEGTGAMDSILAVPGDTIYLPECYFTLPAGALFDHYSDGTNNYKEGDSLKVTESLQLTAVYVPKAAVTYVSGTKTVVDEVALGSDIIIPAYDSKFDNAPYRKEFRTWSIGGKEYAPFKKYTANGDTTITALFNDLPVLIGDGGSCYALMPVDENYTLDLSDKPNGFTMTLLDAGGTENYPNNCSAAFTIKAPDGYVIRTSSYGDISYGDYLYVYDSDGTTELTPSGGVYGSFATPEYTTTGNTLTVRFTSDYSNSGEGFAASVKLIDPTTLATVSFLPGDGSGTMDDISVIKGETFTVPACAFYGPIDGSFEMMELAYYTDGTNQYVPGDQISVTEDTQFTAVYGTKTVLSFKYYRSDYDYWETRTYNYANGARIRMPAFAPDFTLLTTQQFDGWTKSGESTLYPEGAEFTVNGAAEFEAHVSLIPVLKSDGEGGWYANMYSNDDATVDISDKPVGFSFKLYDDGGKEGNYSNHCNSYLTILAPAGTLLKVGGTMTTDYYLWDYLQFFDGATYMDPQLGGSKIGSRSTGKEYKMADLVTTGNALTVRFYSDSNRVYDGFDLTVSVVEPVTVTYTYGSNTEITQVEKNGTVTLPFFENIFTLESGREFIYWSIGDKNYEEGAQYSFAADTTVTAVVEVMPFVSLNGGGALLLDNSGGGVFGPDPVSKGSEYELPHARELFFVPDGKVLAGWQAGSVIYAVGDRPEITQDTVFTAVWVEPSPWDELAAEAGSAASGENILYTLNADLTSGSGSDPIVVPKGVNFTLDLNGHSIDGSAVVAATGRAAIISKGTLIIKNTGAAADITGTGLQTTLDGRLVLDDYEARYTAKVESTYTLIDDDTSGTYSGIYAATYFRTLREALVTAAATVWEEKVTGDEAANYHGITNYSFFFNDETVVMLADATLPEDETWTLTPAEDLRAIWFDLNGHTFDIRGTIDGGIFQKAYVVDETHPDGAYVDKFYRATVDVVSEVPGTIRSGGIVDICLQPWTNDTYYITGGEWKEFFCDGGTYTVTGGTLRNGTFNNGNSKSPLTVSFSGSAAVDDVFFYNYNESDGSAMTVTVSGDVRFSNTRFRLSPDGDGEYSGNKPVFIFNGGYYDSDPVALRRGLVPVAQDDIDWDDLDKYYVARWNGDRTAYNELDDHYKERILELNVFEYSDTCFEEYIQFASAPEKYVSQTDWAVSTADYGWRIKGSGGAPHTHTPAAAVEENRVEPGCETKGSYDSVIYCSECGEQISRETKEIDALGHAWGAWETKLPATDKAEGVEERLCERDASHIESRAIAKLSPSAESAAEKAERVFATVQTEKAEKVTELSGGVRVMRSDGNTRFDTALETASDLKIALNVEKFDTIIVASSHNFPDALAGSYLAAKKSAPIIVVRTTDKVQGVDEAVTYIKENLAEGGVVYILGGESAVSAAAADEIGKAGVSGMTVKRLAGTDRYGTNLEILKEAGIDSGEDLLVADAKSFADALSASALGRPILLINKKNATLDAHQNEFLKGKTFKNIYILGGEAAVPRTIADDIGAMFPGAKVKRLAGDNRYETSAEIANEFFPDPEVVAVATGVNFPDGLTGGSLAYALKSPLVLTRDREDVVKITAEYMASAKAKKLVVFGGESAVPTSLVASVAGK